ncbi:hypothetical protein RRG08_055524 [Elysia crispata]|uniref:Uncharacterized protein n=1 Tax=Elysia crispata TaxID=231223 RepID=A0AAE1APT5_9GAST|nr:hypothetical protein RRG08_055524 [Elysia crispata]
MYNSTTLSYASQYLSSCRCAKHRQRLDLTEPRASSLTCPTALYIARSTSCCKYKNYHCDGLDLLLDPSLNERTSTMSVHPSVSSLDASINKLVPTAHRGKKSQCACHEAGTECSVISSSFFSIFSGLVPGLLFSQPPLA